MVYFDPYNKIRQDQIIGKDTDYSLEWVVDHPLTYNIEMKVNGDLVVTIKNGIFSKDFYKLIAPNTYRWQSRN